MSRLGLIVQEWLTAIQYFYKNKAQAPATPHPLILAPGTMEDAFLNNMGATQCHCKLGSKYHRQDWADSWTHWMETGTAHTIDLQPTLPCRIWHPQCNSTMVGAKHASNSRVTRASHVQLQTWPCNSTIPDHWIFCPTAGVFDTWSNSNTNTPWVKRFSH